MRELLAPERHAAPRGTAEPAPPAARREDRQRARGTAALRHQPGGHGLGASRRGLHHPTRHLLPLAGSADDRRGPQRALLGPLHDADGPRLTRLLGRLAAHGGSRPRRHRVGLVRRRLATARSGQCLLPVGRRRQGRPAQPLHFVGAAPPRDERGRKRPGHDLPGRPAPGWDVVPREPDRPVHLQQSLRTQDLSLAGTDMGARPADGLAGLLELAHAFLVMGRWFLLFALPILICTLIFQALLVLSENLRVNFLSGEYPASGAPFLVAAGTGIPARGEVTPTLLERFSFLWFPVDVTVTAAIAFVI